MANAGRTSSHEEIPPRPPPDDPDAEARERILRTAYELFTRHGLAVVGVDRIVAEAGVAKTTLYRHFHSKDELVVAVLEWHQELWTFGWLEAEIERRATSPAERILAVFDAFDEWFRRDDFEGCLFTNSLLETHDRSSPVRAAAVAALDSVQEVLRPLARDAGVADPEGFAEQLQLLMRGSIVAAVEGRADAASQARLAAQRLLERQQGR